MQDLHDFCVERGIQFVSDQVYHPIYHGPETQSAARLPHATVIGDFSKALCLSGLRIGWMIDRDPRGASAIAMRAITSPSPEMCLASGWPFSRWSTARSIYARASQVVAAESCAPRSAFRAV
jgi:aspartate/methionine/tyrosine aminotransferase